MSTALWLLLLFLDQKWPPQYFLNGQMRRMTLVQKGCKRMGGTNRSFRSLDSFDQIFSHASIVALRPVRSIETIPSFDQWSWTIENHRNQWLGDPKTIEKPSLAMVRVPKNIQWWWCSPKPLKIFNGLFKTIKIFNGLFKIIRFVNCLFKIIEIFNVLYKKLKLLTNWIPIDPSFRALRHLKELRAVILFPVLWKHILSWVEFTHFL